MAPIDRINAGYRRPNLMPPGEEAGQAAVAAGAVVEQIVDRLGVAGEGRRQVQGGAPPALPERLGDGFSD